MNHNEPEPLVGLPAEPPATLKDEARAEWLRYGRELEKLGIITAIDVPAFTAYCQSWGRYVAAEQKISATGEVVWSKSGHPMPNPYRAVANRALKFCQQFWSEFGMTPSSRSRVKVSKGKTSADKMRERFFGVNGGRR